MAITIQRKSMIYGLEEDFTYEDWYYIGGVWYHISWTYNNETKEYKKYVNGELQEFPK